MKNLKFPRAALAFVCLWAFVALFPPTHEIARAIPASMDIFGYNSFGLANQRFDHLAEQSPADPTFLSWKLEDQIYSNSRPQIKKTLREMDALSARFPADLSLPALRLLAALVHPPAIPSGEIEPGQTRARQSTKIQWLDDEDLELASRAARQAEAREPDNAFWPWMDAIFEFARRRNEPGIAALERAAKCARFNNYRQDILKKRMAWLDARAHPIWEERISLFFASPFAPYGTMRETALAATFEAKRARALKNNARAAQIEAAVLGACRVWNGSNDIEITALVSSAAARSSLEKLFGIKAPKETQSPNGSWLWIDPKIHTAKLVRAWATFARQNGQAKAARRADFLVPAESPDPFREFMNRDLWREFGLPAPWGHITVSAPLVLLVLGALCWIGALMWLLGALFYRVALREEEASESAPTRGEVALCANFSTGAFLGVLLLFLRWFWWSPFSLFDLSAYTARGELNVGTPILLSIPGIWLLPVAYAGWKRRHRVVRAGSDSSQEPKIRPRNRAQKNVAEGSDSTKNQAILRIARVLAWGVFLLFGLAAISNRGYDLWDDTLLQMPYSAWVAGGSGILVFALEIRRMARFVGGLPWPRLKIEKIGDPPLPDATVLRLVRVGVWLLCPALLFVALSGPVLLLTWPDKLLLGALALIALGGAFWLERKGARRARFDFTLRLAARSAGVLSLAWSVIFLLGALSLWPARARLNAQLERRLQIGEIAWTREQVAKAPRVSE